MSFAYSPKIATDGLVFYVDAANSKSYVSGSTTWNDISKNNNNGTLTNGPIFDPANKGSIDFDGTNDLVVFNSINSLPSFSISIWFKCTGPGDAGGGTLTIYNTLFGFSGGKRILVATSTNTGIAEGRVLVQMGGSNYFSNISGIAETNSWNNVVYTFEPNTAILYINAIQQTPQTNPSVSFPTADIFLGAYSNPIVAYAMKGNIANTTIHSRTLSATEVLQNYNATKTRFGL
jgi:hypothetical protein